MTDRKRHPSGPYGETLSGMSEQELLIHQKIVDWRRSQAAERNLPLYQVLTNSEVIELALKQPNSLTELREFGLSAHRVSRFGRSLLDAIVAS